MMKVDVKVRLSYVYTVELLDIECALCHVTGVQFDKHFPL